MFDEPTKDAITKEGLALGSMPILLKHIEESVFPRYKTVLKEGHSYTILVYYL